MAALATRQMIDGIEAFIAAYPSDKYPKFKEAVDRAKELEEMAEKLVPDAYDRSPDKADEPPATMKEADGAARKLMRDQRNSQ